MTTIYLLWLVYAGSQAVLGYYPTQAACDAALASARVALAPSKPGLTCLPSARW